MYILRGWVVLRGRIAVRQFTGLKASKPPKSPTTETCALPSEVELVDIRLVEDDRIAQNYLVAADLDGPQAAGLESGGS